MAQEHASLLRKIFGTDFSEYRGDGEGLRMKFMSYALAMRDLYRVYRFIAEQEFPLPIPELPETKVIMPAAMVIGDEQASRAVLQLAHVHGNEPVGLGVMLYGMALSEAGLLKDTKIYAVLGNHSAASYFWEAWKDNPEWPAASRANTRTMIGEEDRMDLNRFLPERATKARENFGVFMDEMLASDNVMLRRGAKLCALVRRPEVGLVFDPHTSRQEPDGIRTINISERQMSLLTKGAFGGLFRGVPEEIRVFPSGLLGKLGQSGEPRITLKELMEAARGENTIPIIGIECGHHENLGDCVPRAASFFNALLYNRGYGALKPRRYDADRGAFHNYIVEGRLGLGWLEGTIHAGDMIYPVQALRQDDILPLLASKQDVAHHFADPLQVIFSKAGRAEIVRIESEAARKEAQGRLAAGEATYLVYQFHEMEEVAKGAVVMVGVPSGAELKTPRDMMMFFPTKSAYVYGNKPGMWPVEAKDADTAAKAKFCYGIFAKEEFNLPLDGSEAAA